MKRLFLCLIAIAAVCSRAVVGAQPQPVQAYTAVFWTAHTLYSSSGKPTTFMQRNVYTRDSSGNMRREEYRPTKGLEHDTSAPLEHVFTASTSPQSPQELPQLRSSKETLVDDANLGTQQFSGFPATGRRRTFRDETGQHTHTVETWFSPTLGLVVRLQNSTDRGVDVFTELAELHLGNPAPPSAEPAPVAGPPIPLLTLYRGLFTLIAHMERDRLANDPNNPVNMAEIEDHLRNKLGISTGQWQTLLETSMKVEAYTREATAKASVIRQQDRATRRENPLATDTLAAGHATLYKMQMDLNAQIQTDIDALKSTVGPDATTHIEAYLQGPMAASTSRVHITHDQVQAMRSRNAEGK